MSVLSCHPFKATSGCRKLEYVAAFSCSSWWPRAGREGSLISGEETWGVAPRESKVSRMKGKRNFFQEGNSYDHNFYDHKGKGDIYKLTLNGVRIAPRRV